MNKYLVQIEKWHNKCSWGQRVKCHILAVSYCTERAGRLWKTGWFGVKEGNKCETGYHALHSDNDWLQWFPFRWCIPVSHLFCVFLFAAFAFPFNLIYAKHLELCARYWEVLWLILIYSWILVWTCETNYFSYHYGLSQGDVEHWG